MATYVNPLPPATIRSKILDALVARFIAQVQGVGIAAMTWNSVSRSGFTKDQMQMGNAIALLDIRETKRIMGSYVMCHLQCHTEFHVRSARGDDPSVVAALVIGEIETVMLSDITCGGLSINVIELGNEIDADGPEDTMVKGVVHWEIQYRHRTGDPRLPV